MKLPQAWRGVERRARIYLIELNSRAALDCSSDPLFRHLNHSCRPNCYLRIIRGRVEVYALRSIAPGVELTVDYGETPHVGGMSLPVRRAALPGTRFEADGREFPN